MSYEELKKYVDSKRSEGVNDEEIKQQLNEKSWDPALIEKAMNSEEKDIVTETIEESKIPTVNEIFKYTWKSFAKNFKKYITASVVTTLLPFFSILILAIPVFYDVYVLKLTAADLVSSSLAPVFIPYIILVVVIAIVLSMLCSLTMTIIVNHDAKIKVLAALKKAWESLPGYIWINFLIFVAVFLMIIPALIVLSMSEMNIVPDSYTYILGGFSILLMIPGIIFSLMFLFAPFAYVVHGARGKVALKSSFHITKNKFNFVLVRLLLLWIVLIVVNIISQYVPALGFFLGLITSPLSVIFLYKLYLSAEYQYKESQKEVETVTE